MKYRIYAIVHAEQFIGEYEAESGDEAIEAAWNDTSWEVHKDKIEQDTIGIDMLVVE